MKPVPDPITGWESNADATSPYRAVCEFYRAFNSRDPALLARNWSHSLEVVLDDPAAGIRRGWPAIRDAYERLLDGPALVRAELFDFSIHESPDLAYFVGVERGYVRARGESFPLAMRVTRLFRRIGTRWRQVHCHGAIEDAEPLARYRAALEGVFAMPARGPRRAER